MGALPTVEGLIESATNFAQRAFEAQSEGEHNRVALYAATALEHLTKATLARRSPTLLVDLRGPGNWLSLVALAGLSEGGAGRLRTVGLRDALARARSFYDSAAVEADLALLVDLRDGVVHAALDEVVEERLLVAFIQQADAALVDLGIDRDDFWGEICALADALVGNASNKALHRAEVKVALAEAAFRSKFGDLPAETQAVVTRLTPTFDEYNQALVTCPACDSRAVADGRVWADVDAEYDEDGIAHTEITVWMTADEFVCQVCGLKLDSLEMSSVGMDLTFQVFDVDPSSFFDLGAPWPIDEYDRFS